ncbi:nucleolar protein 9-like isoform X3 [Pomacea canaliculata]|uniref:nucleolar protein 9-like isoform X3 n=1 Tax=Pomacea canaliculata TaxID=400727 RepID=UPI000D73F2DA|nr:nucleolar protein 9-like isoform X3 [Pomacea canaliculata]
MSKYNQKKFGSRKGSRQQPKLGFLKEETLSYYRRVYEAVKEGFVSDEDKNIFLNNTFNQLVQEALEVAQNQTCSRIIESLISQGLSNNLRKLFVALCADLSISFLDRFASHVFQTLVLHLPLYFVAARSDGTDEATGKNKTDNDEEEDIGQEKVEASFKEVCNFVYKNFETLMTHTYGSHVLRSMLETLSGVQVEHKIHKGKGSQACQQINVERQLKGQNWQVPQNFKELFNKYAGKLMQLCDYEVHLKDTSASPVIQTVLLIWNKTDEDRCQAECKTIIQRVKLSFSSEDHSEFIPDMATSQVGSHLLELIMNLSTPQMLEEMHAALFKGRLLHYAIHPIANYVLQRFMSSLKEKALELSKHVEDVLAVGHLGVIISLADACRRNQHCQDDLVKVLMEAFHCNEPVERQILLPKLIASFITYDVFFKINEDTGKPPDDAKEPLLTSVNLQGSLLVQQLLQFDRPTLMTQGIVGMTPAELSLLCCCPMGSHIVDVFFSSPYVLQKCKDDFLKKLKGLLMEVVCSKNGSRCIENVWKNLNFKQRISVAEELAESGARLHNDRYGRFLYSSFGIAQFLQQRKQWIQHQGALTKRRRMLTDLLHKKEPPSKKQKLQKDNRELMVQDEEDDDKFTAMSKAAKPKHNKKSKLAAEPDKKKPKVILQEEKTEDKVTKMFKTAKSKKHKKSKSAGN